MNYLRQLDLVAPEQLGTPIHIVGCGGIGSAAALALAKMGCARLLLYDDDHVDEHNLPSQFYRRRDLGRAKVDALKDVLEELAPAEVTAVAERVEAQALSGVVLCAVDSMAARQRIWAGTARFRSRVPFFVDGRMGAEVARLYAVTPTDPDHVRFYEGTLYADADAEPDSCTARAIVYNTLAIGALIGNQVKRWARAEPVPREIVFDLKTFTLITR